jgi:hypothetical protein
MLSGRTLSRVAAATVVPTAIAAAPLRAQTGTPFSVQGSALYAGLFGDAYAGLQSGPGGEVQIRYTRDMLSIGVGTQYTAHTIDHEGFSGSAHLDGVFFEPRLVILTSSLTIFPYLSARAAVVRLTLRENSGIEAHGTGGQFNGGGGVLVRISDRVHADVGATYGGIHVNETVDRVPNNVEIVATAPSGRDLFLRAGLGVGIGRDRHQNLATGRTAYSVRPSGETTPKNSPVLRTFGPTLVVPDTTTMKETPIGSPALPLAGRRCTTLSFTVACTFLAHLKN